MIRVLASAALLAVTALLAAGCYTVTVDEPFDPAAAAFISEPGTAIIKGQAFMRQRGGAVVTAAGEDVVLVPVTAYSEARMTALYGDRKSRLYGPTIADNPPAYDALTRKTVADAQGDFTFIDVPPGEYFIVTRVVWLAGDTLQGGGLYERIHVPEGPEQAVQVIMTGK